MPINAQLMSKPWWLESPSWLSGRNGMVDGMEMGLRMKAQQSQQQNNLMQLALENKRLELAQQQQKLVTQAQSMKMDEDSRELKDRSLLMPWFQSVQNNPETPPPDGIQSKWGTTAVENYYLTGNLAQAKREWNKGIMEGYTAMLKARDPYVTELGRIANPMHPDFQKIVLARAPIAFEALRQEEQQEKKDLLTTKTDAEMARTKAKIEGDFDKLMLQLDSKWPDDLKSYYREGMLNIRADAKQPANLGNENYISEKAFLLNQRINDMRKARSAGKEYVQPPPEVDTLRSEISKDEKQLIEWKAKEAGRKSDTSLTSWFHKNRSAAVAELDSSIQEKKNRLAKMGFPYDAGTANAPAASAPTADDPLGLNLK